MKNKTKYRSGEVEEVVSEMEFEDRCDEIWKWMMTCSC